MNTEKKDCKRSIRSARIKRVLFVVYEVVSTALITLGSFIAILYLCGLRFYYVKTGSMGELLPIGSVCVVSTYSDFEDIETGDVISFRANDGMLATHRAIKITEHGIITQGDANNTADSVPVTKEDYIGKTVFAVPKIGAVFNFFHSPIGKIVIVGAIAVLLILGRIYKEKEHTEDISNL